MDKNLEKAYEMLDQLSLAPEENQFARLLSVDLMEFVMRRCSGVGKSSIRARAISAGIAVTLKLFDSTAQELEASGEIS